MIGKTGVRYTHKKADRQTDRLTETDRWGRKSPDHFERGLMISGWSMMKVGLMQLTSMNSPTSWGGGGEGVKEGGVQAGWQAQRQTHTGSV